MESCTSGLIASLITDTEGASAVFKGGFVAYSNEAKIKCGVPAGVIEKYGVYSRETAESMACACRTAFGTDIGIGITGSFANVDTANSDSIAGEADFAIAACDKIYAYHIVLDTRESRHESKLSAAYEIGRQLRKVTGKKTQ